MNKVVTQATIYLGGDIFAKVIPFLLIPYLTHTLGAENYGELSFQLSIVFLLSTVFCFGQDVSYTKTKFSYGGLLSKYIFIFGAVFSTFLLIISLLFFNIFSDDASYNSIIIAGFSVFLINKIYSYYQVNFLVTKYLIIQVTTGLAGALGTYLVFNYLVVDTLARIEIILVVNLIVVIYFISKNSKKHFAQILKYRKKVVAYFFSTSSPILLHGLALTARNTLDRILLVGVLSLSNIGVFSLAYQIASVYFLILTSLNKALMPHFFKLLNKNNISAKHIIKASLVALFISPIVYWLFQFIPESIFLFIFGSEFNGVGRLTGIFIFAFTLQIRYFILGKYLIHLV